MIDDAAVVREVLAEAGLVPDESIAASIIDRGSTSRLLTLAIAGTPLLAKIADDPAILERTSREAAVLRGLADPLAGLAPRLVAARIDPSCSVVVVERIDGRVGDPVTGATGADLAAIIDRLAPIWSLDADDPRVAALDLPDWGRGTDDERPHRRRAERFRRRADIVRSRFPDSRGLPRRLAAVADRYEAVARDRRHRTTRVIHGDLHLGNVVFTDDGPCVLDWQTTSLGDPLDDVVRLVMESADRASLDDLLRFARRLPHRPPTRTEVAAAALLGWAGFVTGLAGRPDLSPGSPDHRLAVRVLGPTGPGELIDEALAELGG